VVEGGDQVIVVAQLGEVLLSKSSSLSLKKRSIYTPPGNRAVEETWGRIIRPGRIIRVPVNNLPFSVLEWRSGRIVMKQKKEVIWSLAMEMMACGVGSQEPANNDFPSTKGLHLYEAIEGCRLHLYEAIEGCSGGIGVVFNIGV
jgi:hypothetical protein